MRKNYRLILTKVLYSLFIIGTIISLFIVSKDIKNSTTYRFLMGYFFFTLFFILYVPLVTILNSRKLKWIIIRKRLLKFIAIFIVFGVFNYFFDYVFRPSKIDLFREFSIAFGLAFGISFFDVTFYKNRK